MSRAFVEILSEETCAVVKSLGPYTSERQAEKAERGVSANLDHDRYYTRVTLDPAETQSVNNKAPSASTTKRRRLE